MKVLLISLVQFIGWLLFILTDYIEETTHNDFFLITIYAAPIAVAVLYLIFDKKVHNANWSKIANRICTTIIWASETFIIAAVVIWLDNNDMWIIQQGNTFFNGIEYVIFPMFFGVVPVIITAIWDIIKFFIKILKKGIDN